MLLKLAQLDGSGQALAVGQWQSLCLEGLADERYPIRLSALSQLSSLAESAEASLTPVRGPKPPPSGFAFFSQDASEIVVLTGGVHGLGN